MVYCVLMETVTMDSATRTLLAAVVDDQAPPPNSAALFEMLSARNTQGPSMLRVERFGMETPGDPSVELTVFVPTPAPEGLIVYLGRARWEGATALTRQSVCRRIAERTSCAVLTVSSGPDVSGPPSVDDLHRAAEEARSAMR